ncbi:PIN domain-containing protein [Candidatus Woesearchaeota archaeon]|nr:PIN domain-containing protein [Candidatus Woesearchaeota archaeon]
MEKKSLKKFILVDTDLIIDLLRGYNKSKPFFKDIEESKYDAYVSVITIMELMSGKSTTSTEEQIKIQNVIDLFKIINIDSDIAKNAGFINRDYDISFPDALIASCAKTINNCSIVTRNKKHYEKIKGLKIFVPY